MTSLKKLLAKQQIESILSTYPVVVWYQTTQKSTKEWNKVKEKVHKIQNTLNVPNESNKVLQQYQIIQTKAALLRVVLQEKDNNPLWLSPCQGQLIVCGCSTVEAFQELLKVFDQEKEGFILFHAVCQKDSPFCCHHSNFINLCKKPIDKCIKLWGIGKRIDPIVSKKLQPNSGRKMTQLMPPFS